MNEFILIEQKNEVWFERYDAVFEGEDSILGHALITVDPVRGRNYSALIALLRKNGEITFLINKLPIEQFEQVIREFRQILDDLATKLTLPEHPVP